MARRPEGNRFARLPQVGTILSLLTCYGTLALVGLLSAMGVTLAIDLQIWAAAIVAFAFLAVLGIFFGRRVHARNGPVLLAFAGALAIALSMYAIPLLEDFLGVNRDHVEMGGFVFLVAATLADWRARRGVKEPPDEEPGIFC